MFIAQKLGDPGLHSCILWLTASLHASIGSIVSARVSTEEASKLSRRCCGIAEVVEGKLSSIAVDMSVSSCDIAAVRITLHEIADIVGRKHTISGGSGSYVGHASFKQFIIALLLQGNIELLENPNSTIMQHELALQVRDAAAQSRVNFILLQIAQQAAAPLMVARASCFLLEVAAYTWHMCSEPYQA